MEVSVRTTMKIRRIGVRSLLAAAVLSAAWGQNTGVVEGFVGFAENYPSQQKLTVTKDQTVCGHSVLDREFVVDPATKGLANAVIFWELPEGQTRSSEEGEPAILAQESCRYEPHIQVASPSSKILRVLNNDGILHNVHVFDSEGQTFFNFAQPAFKKQIDKELPATKVINVKCDVHEWMNAYILVLDQAVHAITDEQGRFRLEGLAPGRQRISI